MSAKPQNSDRRSSQQPDDSSQDDAAEVIDMAEAAAEAPAVETPESRRIAELERELLATQEKLRQYSTAVDRARSEFEAARSRLEREQARIVEAQKVAAVGGLLGVLDSLDQALHAVGDGGMAFIQGVAMIRTQFETALRDIGLERFESLGQPFDPERHEAISILPVADPAQDNVVVQELKHGASVGEKVVRPATVIVGRYDGSTEPAEA